MKICSKPLSCKDLEHRCEKPCHAELCPLCPVTEEVRCWCGSETNCGECNSEDATKCVVSKSTLPDGTEEEEEWFGSFGCGKICSRPFSCGTHTCSKPCHPPSRTPPLCPFDPISVTRCGCDRCRVARYGDEMSSDDTSPILPARASCTSPLPVCSSACSKPLPCGHSCTATCHWGACPPCTMDVLKPCRCGSIKREVKCSAVEIYQQTLVPASLCEYCSRGATALRREQYFSHVSSVSFLDRKLCVCEKKMVDNVQCSQERVNCGNICRRLFSCGFHECRRTCHADECGPCTMICGKSRKTCLPDHHPCPETRHAPAACPETGPCLTPVTLTCPCGNRRSTVPCSNKEQRLACNEDCAVRKRNEKPSEAFGISREKREEMAAGPKAIWSDELVDFYARATANAKFVRLMEDTLAEFVKSSRRTQVLQCMTAERRKFVQGLASVYRVDTTEVDQEPPRSVRLIRRIDTRIPVPLLSQSAVSAASSSKLVDLRSSKATLRGTGAELSKSAASATAVKTAYTPCSQITRAWKMPSSLSSSSSRNTPPPYVANKSGASSSGPLPPHLSGPSPPSYATLEIAGAARATGHSCKRRCTRELGG
ncbi:hypothetical protein EDD15DRAFT_392135 [Pisolithus albus]|nr:hypothetical protein EDD15DRAFT_392135 [Pisolithus albus]